MTEQTKLPVVRTNTAVIHVHQIESGEWITTVAWDALRDYQSPKCGSKQNAIALACVHILTSHTNPPKILSHDPPK